MHTQPVQSLKPESIQEPYDYPTRWLVKSSSSEHTMYLVDLGSYNNVGECQCIYWRTTVGPKVKKGQVVRCRHINIARERFTNWAIKEFHDKDPDKGHDREQLER